MSELKVEHKDARGVHVKYTWTWVPIRGFNACEQAEGLLREIGFAEVSEVLLTGLGRVTHMQLIACP